VAIRLWGITRLARSLNLIVPGAVFFYPIPMPFIPYRRAWFAHVRLIGWALLFTAALAAKASTVAVIGLVHAHGWSHLKEMVQNRDVTLVGVAEPNPALLKLAREAGVPENLTFADYVQMLDSVKPDFVWAFVENNRHLEIARACATRGINVIFEKPLASSYADAVAIRDLAQKSGIFVMTNYQMAWWPTNYTAKRLAESGELGGVYRLRGLVGNSGPGDARAESTRIFYAWLKDPAKNGAGALIDFGCYNVLWSLWYFGRPASVYALAGQLQPERNPKEEDYATFVLKYKDREAILEGSWDLPQAYQDLEIFGLKGTLYMTEQGVAIHPAGHPERQAASDPLPPEMAGPLACMANAIKTHRAPGGMVGLDLNVQVMEIIEAAKESVRTGKAVPLSPN